MRLVLIVAKRQETMNVRNLTHEVLSSLALPNGTVAAAQVADADARMLYRGALR
jgi:hypothetical protein